MYSRNKNTFKIDMYVLILWQKKTSYCELLEFSDLEKYCRIELLRLSLCHIRFIIAENACYLNTTQEFFRKESGKKCLGEDRKETYFLWK